MARFDTSGIDGIVRQMKDLGELTGKAAEEMLMAGAAEVKKAWKQAAEEAGHRDLGDMINSIGYPRKPKDVEGVKTIDIYPQGKDRKKVRNAEKAFILHYGTTKIKGSRWVDRADELSAEPVQKVMGEIWDKRLKEKGLI